MIGPAIIYPLIKLKGNVTEKGLKFGALMWLVYSVPSSYIILTSMTYPIGFHFDALVVALVAWLLSGLVIAKIFK